MKTPRWFSLHNMWLQSLISWWHAVFCSLPIVSVLSSLVPPTANNVHLDCNNKQRLLLSKSHELRYSNNLHHGSWIHHQCTIKMNVRKAVEFWDDYEIAHDVSNPISSCHSQSHMLKTKWPNVLLMFEGPIQMKNTKHQLSIWCGFFCQQERPWDVRHNRREFIQILACDTDSTDTGLRTIESALCHPTCACFTYLLQLLKAPWHSIPAACVVMSVMQLIFLWCKQHLCNEISSMISSHCYGVCSQSVTHKVSDVS